MSLISVVLKFTHTSFGAQGVKKKRKGGKGAILLALFLHSSHFQWRHIAAWFSLPTWKNLYFIIKMHNQIFQQHLRVIRMMQWLPPVLRRGIFLCYTHCLLIIQPTTTFKCSLTLYSQRQAGLVLPNGNLGEYQWLQKTAVLIGRWDKTVL